MSVTTVQDIDLAASYVNRNHSRCGCVATYSQKRCEHCRPTVQICCLKVTRDGWVEDVLLARDTSGLAGQGGVSDDPWDTAWTTGSMCSDKGMTNLCGRVVQRWNTTSSCLPIVTAEWIVAPDCETVSLTLKQGTTDIASWPDLPRDWYTSPLTATDEILGGTVTVAVCDTTDVPFPSVAPEELMLYGIAVDTLPGDNSPGRGLGTELCGEPYECPGEANTGGCVLRWEYSLETGDVTVMVICGTTTVASTSFPYAAGWADAYTDTPLVIPVDYFLGATHVTTGEYHVSKVASCADVPPDEDCEPYMCYPLCVANTCPSDPPDTVNASAVFVTANDGATDYTDSATWSDITGEYSFSVDVGELCGTLSGRIYCDGEDIKVDFDLFDGFVHTYETFTVSWSCVDGDVSWTTPTAVSGISCALDITLWTNNMGGG